MNITKLEHSGFIIEKNGRRIAIDPVEFAEKLPEITELDALIITHKHSDHFQPAVVERLRAANPGVVVFTTFDNAEAIAGAEAVKYGDRRQAGEFELEFFGINHAEIVPDQVPCQNIGVIVDGVFAHLGDSLDEPTQKVGAIALANAAPWLKLHEAMDYIAKCGTQMIIPCHDAILSELGESISNNWLGRASEEAGATYNYLRPGQSLIL